MQSELDHAGFGMRLIAFLVDGLITTMIATMVYFLVTGELSAELTNSYAYIAFDGLYLTILPAVWGGYTLAKRMVSIRVRKLDGSDVTLFDMFVRDFIGKVLLSVITFGVSTVVSLVMVLAMKQRRAIHDYMAGTYVYSD
ncbi:RDD family protein [Salimicrobium flavidum]|uniref:Uncharacterized membrane protein YckC, RDD family n=1 Tax=Salimicrobium flavidum TaxID=570947 RepID=A0A1N7IS65_9BACI|nr:RDD family protein [Salimicrobium flavidum]SIS39932.1 Uncharacterized membrane protein YckC, RDD family [Salimicrobium flavidum]